LRLFFIFICLVAPISSESMSRDIAAPLRNFVSPHHYKEDFYIAAGICAAAAAAHALERFVIAAGEKRSMLSIAALLRAEETCCFLLQSGCWIGNSLIPSLPSCWPFMQTLLAAAWMGGLYGRRSSRTHSRERDYSTMARLLGASGSILYTIALLHKYLQDH
jgi:hypothetical protein